jgi:NADH dehydrogenase
MTSVVIVGSGFTGFECARRLLRQLRRHKADVDVDVTIISPIDSGIQCNGAADTSNATLRA